MNFLVSLPSGVSPSFIMNQAVEALALRRSDLEGRQNALLDELAAVRRELAELEGTMTRARQAGADLDRLHDERGYATAEPVPGRPLTPAEQALLARGDGPRIDAPGAAKCTCAPHQPPCFKCPSAGARSTPNARR